MGSRRLITVLLVCLVIYNDIPNTQANVGNHQEERHEYQYQRSSKVVGGTGYYNSRSGNAEQTAENFDGWTQSQRDQVEGMAEKLRTELSTAQPYYGQGCSKICALIPGFAGRSQEEIDQIAKEMTTQIIEDLQSGKLVRSQMNQPNWFEHQVAQKIIDLRKHHEEQYQQNVYRATSRFHENQGSQVQPDMYAGGGTYNKETEDVQQQQENVFTDDDLRQIQQSVFDQRQQQQQGNFYQQQSQNQQHTVYTRPVNRYYNTQTTSRDSTNEQRFRTVYPTPMVVTNNVNKEMEDTEYTRTQTIPVVIPTQRTTTTTNVHVTQEEKEVRRQPQLPRVYNREENTAERETIYNRNRPSIVPPPRRTSYEVHNTEEEQKIVEVHTPSPVPATNNRHSIYNHVEESEVVPNYQPRVTIDKNTEFEILDHRRDYRPQVPTTHTQTTIHERQEEKHHQHHIPVTPATPETTYWEDRNDVEVTQVVQQVTPRYQPSTSHHVITVKNEETSSHLRPRPYPVYPNHGLTFERNQTSTSTSFGRPTYPIYPSFRTNATTFENGDTYIRYESHIPTTYVIKLTAEEYEERLHHLRNVMSHLGYARLTDEEYNATIAAGGFTHNGYKFIYNGDSGRFEKITVTDLTVEEYKDRLYCLRNELNLLGYTRMTETEYNETIATGRFTYNGYNYVYNGNTGRFEKTTVVMDLTDKEYADRLYRLRNTLNQLGYNRMTETEYNETIATGSFTYNGYNYVYNGNTGRFEKTTVVMDLTEEEYADRLYRLRNTLNLLGYNRMTEREYNETIATGSFTYNGYNYVYNGSTGRFEKTTIVIDLTEEEYADRLYRLRNALNQLGYNRMTDTEYNETIATGSFTYNGYNYVYNGNTGRFEKTTVVIDLTEEEYADRLYRLRNTLNQLGYNRMTETEYNETIATGSFTYNGYNYVYNGSTGRFEKTTIVIDLTEEEYADRLYRLRNALNQLGYNRMTDIEYNETIATGSFRYNGYNYVYNGNTGRFEKTTVVIDLTEEEYSDRLYRLRNALNLLGYNRMTDREINETIATGSFTYNGYKYVYNGNTGRYEEATKVEYEAIYKILQQKLREIGFGEMCQQEVQQAITTGVFIRDGNKFVYDSGREQYEKIRITNEERKEIFSRIQVLLRREGLRLLTQKENEGVLINGHFIRAAHQWIYNIVNGTIVKTIFVGDFAEFTDDEYREIYQKIQETLRSIGYAQMSDGQCNATITSGTFERGGIYWSYNPDNGKFERILLSQEEYRDRVQILRNALHRLGHRKLSAEEFREIIYQGYFYHGGYRYEYVRQQRRYKRIEFTAEEYRERLRQLQEQLIKIGYGIMDEALCNSTITTGKFYFNGHEWVYSFKTRDYQIGKVSSVSGRGDIPATFFGEDYGSDEMVESEPGVGYYPIGKKPEVGLSTPEPFDRIRENTEIPTTTRPEPTFIVPNEYQRDRYKHEQHLTTQMWPTQPTTVSERRYHRKQTTYTQTTGVQPQTFATQRSTRHVPGSEFGEDNELEETSTPFEPLVVSTQAYLVYDNGNGNERPRPYRPDDQSEIIERYLNNERPYSPKYYGSDNNEYQQQTDPTPENIEDLGDLDFNGQAEEDVQQQLVDLDFEAEDLRQQQVDVNSDDDRNDQQRLLDGYARESGRTEYNSHYHGQKETADEYDAQVVQVTDKADGDNKESPGLWTRFKDKTKDIFG
ncbi:uncharacterized protein LOC119070817 isoform X2 [Bradysia coprophila]|uniref:uncharacterized protein LOC119070817 isoform X2 n=1 Tax=Bradysia coprophila TaxID=38358 RepID=UPI00187DD690|nr:uncharacterized protein LOC119070817 isoform X2 [Bradysia coprophila]